MPRNESVTARNIILFSGYTFTIMTSYLTQFLLHWGAMALALWATAGMFKGVSFTGVKSILLSALLLGMANAVVRPVVIFFTLPLTLITLGGFLLVVNAMMLMLVSTMVKGFKVSGFWTALFASTCISIFSFLLELLIYGGGANTVTPTAPVGLMV